MGKRTKDGGLKPQPQAPPPAAPGGRGVPMDDMLGAMAAVPIELPLSPRSSGQTADNASGNREHAPVVPLGRTSDQGGAAEVEALLQGIAKVVTALWRVRSRLDKEGKAELPSSLRHLPRHVQAAWDGLTACGIEVQDHVGERYDPGMAVTPVACQPVPGVAIDTIAEALKPTIYYKGRMIQKADVIVAGPPVEPASAPTPGEQ